VQRFLAQLAQLASESLLELEEENATGDFVLSKMLEEDFAGICPGQDA
jgi:hypothetical protein